MSYRTRLQLSLEFLLEFFCLGLANSLSILIFRFMLNKVPHYERIEWIRYAGIMVVAYLIIFFSMHSRIDIQDRNRLKEILSLMRNAMLTYSLFTVLIVILKSPLVESRYMLVFGFLFYISLLTVGRYLLKRYLTGQYTKSKTARMVGVISTTERAEKLVESIKDDWSINITGVVLLDSYCIGNTFTYGTKARLYEFNTSSVLLDEKESYPDSVLGVPVVATDDSFIEWMRSSPLDEVFLDLPYTDDSEVQALIEELEDMGVTVHVNIPMLDDILSESKFNNISCKMQYGYPMATFAASELSFGGMVLKRAADIILGTVGSLVSLPIILITAIPLLAESKGPLIFKQERVGKNGRVFNIYKLRSMYADAEERKAELMKQNKMEGFMFKMDDDPRITKVGRFIRKYSIDELPQFFNVVKGDMSLVGTRPPTVDEFIKYESRHKRRLSMRPGITGMWQVSGRSNIQDFEDVVELDCQYIDEWSPLLDIKILFKTVGVVLTHKGAE